MKLLLMHLRLNKKSLLFILEKKLFKARKRKN